MMASPRPPSLSALRRRGTTTVDSCDGQVLAVHPDLQLQAAAAVPDSVGDQFVRDQHRVVQPVAIFACPLAEGAADGLAGHGLARRDPTADPAVR